jgi:hypothetical protein
MRSSCEVLTALALLTRKRFPLVTSFTGQLLHRSLFLPVALLNKALLVAAHITPEGFNAPTVGQLFPGHLIEHLLQPNCARLFWRQQTLDAESRQCSLPEKFICRKTYRIFSGLQHVLTQLSLAGLW